MRVHIEALVMPNFHDWMRKLLTGLNGYDWEILVVNDGSSDETQRVIESLREKDPRNSKEPSGVGQSRPHLQGSRGRHICHSH